MENKASKKDKTKRVHDTKTTVMAVNKDAAKQFRFLCQTKKVLIKDQLEILMNAWMESVKSELGIVLPKIK